MDPNACLQTVRDAYRALRLPIDADRPGGCHVAEIAAGLARAVEDLDAYLCRGGYAPAAWAGAAR